MVEILLQNQKFYMQMRCSHKYSKIYLHQDLAPQFKHSDQFIYSFIHYKTNNNKMVHQAVPELSYKSNNTVKSIEISSKHTKIVVKILK